MKEQINLFKKQQACKFIFFNTLVLLMDNPGCFKPEESSPSRLKESSTMKDNEIKDCMHLGQHLNITFKQRYMSDKFAMPLSNFLTINLLP